MAVRLPVYTRAASGSTDVASGAPAAHASTHIQGASDEIDGDKLNQDYSPSNYTPTIAATSTATNQVASHFKGVDNALATKAALANAVMDGDAAGGALGGTYPNPTCTLAGDVSGATATNTVDKIKGVALDTASVGTPSDGQAIYYDNASSKYKAALAAGDVSGKYRALSVDKLKGVTLDTTTIGTPTNKGIVYYDSGSTSYKTAVPGGDVSGIPSAFSVDRIKATPVHTTAPTDGQVLQYIGANSRAEWTLPGWGKIYDQDFTTLSNATLSVGNNTVGGVTLSVIQLGSAGSTIKIVNGSGMEFKTGGVTSTWLTGTPTCGVVAWPWANLTGADPTKDHLVLANFDATNIALFVANSGYNVHVGTSRVDGTVTQMKTSSFNLSYYVVGASVTTGVYQNAAATVNSPDSLTDTAFAYRNVSRISAIGFTGAYGSDWPALSACNHKGVATRTAATSGADGAAGAFVAFGRALASVGTIYLKRLTILQG